MNQESLAIVIPYYKGRFFCALLDALREQTNKNFYVYVGDDCSPESPTCFIKAAQTQLSISYVRFDSRLGHISLAAQWNRCVQMTQGEEWVWIIPDDDLPSANCVEEFYKVVQAKYADDVNVLVIPTQTIDESGRILRKAEPLEGKSSNYSFYMRQLKGQMPGSSLGENIFRASCLERMGGFPEFPKAWGSDHAGILGASSGGFILFIKDALFSFRQSGINISSQRGDGAEKMRGRVQFAQWIRTRETIFPVKPDMEFYQYLYWKGEYYAVHEWSFSWEMLWQLFRLRVVCCGSWNIFAVMYLLATKSFRSKGK